MTCTIKNTVKYGLHFHWTTRYLKKGTILELTKDNNKIYFLGGDSDPDYFWNNVLEKKFKIVSYKGTTLFKRIMWLESC